MEWVVHNAINKDIERQELNKILKEVRTEVTTLTQALAPGSSVGNDIQNTVGEMVSNNTEVGVVVTYNLDRQVLDFVVSEFTLSLIGDVQGSVTMRPGESAAMQVTLSGGITGIPDAPQDNEYYWRRNGAWEAVDPGITDLADIEGDGFSVHTDSPGDGVEWFIRQFDAVAGELTITDGDGIAGNPTYGLADVVDSGVGVSPVKLITVDSKGRVVGTEDADTDDLPEGTTNLYFTDERAQDAVGTILVDSADIDFTYDDTTPSITAILVTPTEAGTYTPTVTGVTNVDSTTANQCQYMRVGSVVTVSGSIDVDATAAAATLTAVGISLPIASSLSATTNLAGSGTANSNPFAPCQLSGDATNDRAELQFYATITSSVTCSFTFTYLII